MSALKTKAVAVALLAISASAQSVPATAQSVEEFYKTRPLTVIVGYSPGGGYDTHVRSVMRYYGRHIPGNPNIVVQNMTGAGSLVATNHLYNLAPKDGSVIGMVRAPVLEPLTGTSASNFDATKFNWIGSGMTEFTVCALLGAPTVKTFADATKTPITLAGSGPGSDDDMISKLQVGPEAEKFLRDPNSCGGSVIVNPLSRVLAGPMGPEEGILYADCDLQVGVQAKLRHDFAGHYNRPDIFQLQINRSTPHIYTVHGARDNAALAAPAQQVFPGAVPALPVGSAAWQRVGSPADEDAAGKKTAT